MTELDRRAVVTGLAAVAVAGVAPANATPPVPLLVRSGHCHEWRSYQPRELISTTYETAMRSRWHVDMRGRDDVTYLHVTSGFYFAVYPQRPTYVWFICAPDELPLVYGPDRKPISRAIVFAHHTIIALARAQRGRDGSFIVDHQDPRHIELVCEDAPSLPTVEPYADGVSRVERLCRISPLSGFSRL